MLGAWRAPGASVKRSMRALLMAVLCGFAGAICSYPSSAASHEATVLEEQIKAAMVFKFLSYIDWPQTAFDTADSPYRIWILGADRIATEFQEIIAERSVGDRPIEVFKARNVSRIKRPHLVYVGQHAQRHLPRLADLAKQEGFIIVTESEQGLSPGSTINLRLIDGRMSFDVSLTTAQKSNLRLSARLLSVASTIEQQEAR